MEAHDTNQTPNRGRLTVARTLRLGSIILLSLFIAAGFLSFQSIQSIGDSFDHVVSVEQPLRETATDMIDAADASTIAFLQSLVSNEPVSARGAEEAFDRHMSDFRSLVYEESSDLQGAKARDLFSRLQDLGTGLVATDQHQQRAFIALEKHFEQMDDRLIDPNPFLRSIEPDFAEAARWVGNYLAAPSPEYAAESLEEIDDAAGELAVMAKTRTGAQREVVVQLIRGLAHAKKHQVEIISLTNSAESDIRLFLGLRAHLDQLLDGEIEGQVESSLLQQTRQTQQVVGRSKILLIAIVVPGLVFGIIALLWVRKRITRPVHSLMTAIDSLRSGQAPAAIELSGNDEFSILGHALTEATKERALLEDQLRHQAFHDPLTALANRTLFMERVEHAVSRGDRSRTPISVLFVDLDDFKDVNDSMGHDAGDQVLVSVAARLNGCVRAQDTVARLGGDEFGVLLEETDEKGAKEVAERAAKALGALLTIGNDQVSTSASIGVATRHEDEDVDALLVRADAAMYAAKSRGAGLWQAFEPNMDVSIDEANTVRAQLERAVRNNEFVVHYQPIVDIETQAPVAVEALVRWNHPERGLLAPVEFLGAAEESGHILYIDKWVLNEACRQVKVWQTEMPNASSLSACVNLSARQLEHPGLAEEVAEALRTSGLAPEHLTVELTETVLVRDVDAATVELKKLKEIGVRIALDDFGTGYSSLNYLRNFPIDVLKIDRSFVAAIGERPDQLEVGLALVEFSQRLGLVTVAEGIEELGQLSSLSDLGCELGQGYLFAKPLASQQLEAFLKEGVTAIVV